MFEQVGGLVDLYISDYYLVNRICRHLYTTFSEVTLANGPESLTKATLTLRNEAWSKRFV